MTRAELIQYITDNVYPNARNEVTAPMVRDSLLEIVDFLGDAATYNIGMVASGNQGLVTGGNVNTAIALALLPYYTAQETGQAIDDAIARIGLGQAAYKNIGQVAENNTDLVTGGQVYTAINTALTSAIKFQGISDTPLTDGSTTNPIQINGQSYTAKKGDMVVYGGNEFLWVGNKWQQMGDESSYALKTIQITGTGYLTGGGDLTQSRTLDISATAKGYIDHGEAAYNYFPDGVLDSTHLPSMYIGTTSVQFTAAAQNLTGISSVRATSNVLTLFEWDVTNSAWHFHGNIYTDGWFSGGGISPGGGGGGGGIDPVAMWRLLTNDPSLTQYDNYTKISADHINFPVTSVVGLGGNVTAQQIAQALNLGSFAYKNSLSVSDIPDLSGTYVTLSTAQTISGKKTYTNGIVCQYDGEGSFNEGVRVNESSNGWSSLVLGGARLTISGNGENVWTIATNDGHVYFGRNGADYYVHGFDITKSGVISFKGTGLNYNGNDILHTGNFRAGYEYLPMSGGTLQAAAGNFFSLNATSGDDCWQYFRVGGTDKASVGYYGGLACVANEATYARIGVNDAGVPQYWPSSISSEAKTLYHSGNSNKSDVAWTCSSLTASSTISTAAGQAIYIGTPGGSVTSSNAGYISAGPGFSINSGRYGVRVLACDQSDCQSGLGQDLAIGGGWANAYNFCLVGGNSPSADYGYISFVTHKANSTNYRYLGGFYDDAGSVTFQVRGVIYASTGIYTDGWFSGGGVASSSDRRLKKNIKNFAYTPKLLLSIRPREWDWKDGSAMVGHAAGFVAQEIEPIMPYAVDGTRNFKALFYDRFHALEIAGLQDHERRIVELERAVKERDKKIAKLEKMLKLN